MLSGLHNANHMQTIHVDEESFSPPNWEPLEEKNQYNYVK